MNSYSGRKNKMLRNNFIKKYIKRKEVLHLGFLGEDTTKRFSPIHEFLLKNSKNVMGIDIDKKRVDVLKKKGFDVMCDDAITLVKLKETNRKFDVVLAGEIIEHLENPKDHVENIKQLLSENGVAIFTTPNIYSLRFMIRHTLFGQESPYWKDRTAEVKYGHVIGFSRILFENFLLRNGYEIVETSYVIKNEYSGFRSFFEKLISSIIPKFAPTLVFVVKLKK